MPIATFTALQNAGIIIGIVVGVGTVLFGAVNVWLSVSNERKRTQPIVIAHQEGQRRFVEHSERQAIDIYVTNEGAGAAFNVQFGVELHGVRLAYKHAHADSAASVYRVVRPGERLPSNNSWPIEIDPLLLLCRKGSPDSSQLFWARYENAQGKLWETRNPGNRSGRIGIQRIRGRRIRELREEHKRKRAMRRGARREAAAVEDLRDQKAEHAQYRPERPQEPPAQP